MESRPDGNPADPQQTPSPLHAISQSGPAPIQSSFHVAAPSISLPKGGGAIRGIGEKFSANPVTGTGSMTVPITTFPGRSGFGPQLALSYDSGAGNGPFGFGWSLSLPVITRKTEKALPTYLDGHGQAADSDVFTVSGAEDLVPEFERDATGAWVIQNGQQQIHDKSRTVNNQTYQIRRYRPRIEGLFARIERWTNTADSSDVFWRSISKDNISSWYGRTAESRIADPSHSGRIFSWLICQSHDDKGNVIVYGYKLEDSARILEGSNGNPVSKTHERNRTDETRKAQRYLKSIRYGNRVPYFPDLKADAAWPEPPAARPTDDGSNTWMFEVIFDYGEHDANAPTPNDTGIWPARQDPFSSYRAGFEVRTYRTCQRVLMFHHFPGEAGVGHNCLVRSTDCTYSDEVNPADVRNPVYSFLKAVTQTGYRRINSGYDSRSLPQVEFEYTEPIVQEIVEDVDPASLENLPIGVDGNAYQWTDLHGEGIPGILSEQGGAWFYKRNWSPMPDKLPDGSEVVKARLAPLETVALKPNVALSGGGEFMDLAGDGQPDLAVLDGPMSGLFEHDLEEEWEPFRPFTSRLNRDMRDPNLKFVDLDGDGHADVLITEDDAFVWHPSLAEEGFGPAQRVSQPFDEEKGPRVVFADGTQSIYLADLSGDGLTDIVRIRNGDVCYWPNLGYGRFGAKVTMDNAPWFDNLDQFDQKRIRLADIDGSGTTDIIYLHRDGVSLYFNQSGNNWSQPQRLKIFPRIDDLVSIVPVDLLGNGTACLVWSSPLLGDTRRPMRYVNLMGGQKPHLLVKTINNLGAETRVEYAPSTKFYLQDKRDGKPWFTRLPFPVHVVERVQTFDHITRNRFVTRYAYHHGYFDGEEREFRGFGMVEQFDTEAFEDYVVGVQAVGGAQEQAPELNQSPVTTRTWYHTGAFLDQPRILHQYRHEYYRQEQHIPEPILPVGLSASELRECVRALKGLPLRQEIYSYDGSAEQAHPYTVSENNFEIRWVQPRGGQRHGVFCAVGHESISLNYERNPSDPRISHSFGLDLDEYGNARKSCAVVYGRKMTDASLPDKVTDDQQHRYITYAEADYTPDILQTVPVEAYRLRVPFESRNYEITGIVPDGTFFLFEEIKNKIATAAPIDYEIVADGATAQKRLLSQSRTLFLDNTMNPLPLGQWDSLGLGHQSYKLAFTLGVTAAHYAGKINDAEFTAAGYVHFAGDANWWVPSGTAVYSANPRDTFYLPIGAKNPFGLETIATFDQHILLTEKVEVKQAAWNVVTAVNDYRVLGPVLMTDPNGNRSAVEHDELGMVVKTAVMGKAGSPDGDTLADPTTRLEYELFNWMNNRKPNFVHTFAREQHGVANPRWQESYAYSNGSGGVVMVKVQAHPGKAFKVSQDGSKTEVDADPRWVGNGRTVLNNKGKPVKQYEPYFSTTHEYEDEKVLREIGATPILYYDPVGRNIRTLFPNGTFAKVEFTPWWQKVFDANDTVKQSQWYADRGSPDPTAQPEPLNDPERRAAWLAAKHAGTPGVIHFDSLGRPIYAVSDYGGGKTAAVRSESDLTGRLSKMFDQAQREVASGFVGMAGTPIVGDSAEKGRRWTFQNVLGALVKTWDEHGRQFRAEYDNLHRPISAFVQQAGQAEILFNYVVYGDHLGPATAQTLNLLGTTHLIFDQAGMVRVPQLDFKGNPKSVDRILAKDYKNDLDWSALPGQADVAAIQVNADPALETAEVFTAGSLYDALNRPTWVTLPDGTIIVPTYNKANFLASLKAQIRGQGNFIEFLKDQDYDAKGQRMFARYGNEVFTRYFYDPKTFRLTNLLTHKSVTDPEMQGLQNLNYHYDPVGNITQIRDDAQQTHYFNNAVVKPENLYEYDAIYQLIRAKGRELTGGVNDAVRTHTDLDFVPLPHPNNLDAVRNYTEEYEYDLLGNIKVLKHRFQPHAGIGGGWTRQYRYAFDDAPSNRTNRLIATSMPGDPDGGPYSGTYAYDAYGNMSRMPHLATMDWNFMDQLRRVDLGSGGTAHYVYGLSGQRLRKVIERNGNLKLEWIFLGAVMIHRRRRRNTNELRLERWTVHIGDNTGHIAQVDTKIRDDDNDDPANPLNVALIRYQYANHLGSAVLETDENGNPLSYEEYHPYGTTAYRSAKPGVDLSLKRYRFSGKELDDETGLYYFGARYYASWLGRWVSSDPAGLVSGPNLYRYCRNSPSVFIDPIGMKEQKGTVFVDPKSDEAKLANPSREGEARSYLQGVYTSRLKDQSQEFRIDKMHFNEKGKYWVIDKWHLAPRADSTSTKDTSPNIGGSAGATSQAPETIKKNPTGPTVEVPNQFSDQKLDAMQERIETDRGVGLRGEDPAGGGRTEDIRARSENLRNQYNNSLPPNQRASRANGIDIDHTVELQYIIRGNSTAGADTVRSQDHAPQASGANRSDGRAARTVSDRQIANGVPEDVPAGGVARSSEMGLLKNQVAFRTGMRWAGYGLMALGPALTAYGASQANNPYIKKGGFGAAVGEAGGGAYYFYGRFALGGAKGFQAGRAAMALGGRIAMGAGGVGQALLSGYMAVEDFQQGDWTAFGFDAAAAVGGVALVAAAIVSAPALATGLAIAGIVTGVAAGVFHAGRYFGWWN